MTADPFRRGVRLLRTTELAAELGRTDTVADAIAATSGLDLAPAERTRLVWLRELYDEHEWSGATRLDAFADIAEQMLDVHLPEEANKALLTVAVRVHWSNADDEIRHRILAIADRLPLPADHPARIALLALVDPETRGAEALSVIARHAISPGDDPGLLRLLGSAATAVGAFDLAPAFLTGAVAGLRRQGRLGLLAQAQVSMAWSAVHTGAMRVGLPAAAEAARLSDETGQPRWRAVAQFAHATLEGLRGDEERSEALVAAAEATLIPMGANPLLALAALARGKTALAAGRHSNAFDELRRVFDPNDTAYMPYVRPWGLADLVDAAVHAGRVGRGPSDRTRTGTDRPPLTYAAADRRARLRAPAARVRRGRRRGLPGGPGRRPRDLATHARAIAACVWRVAAPPPTGRRVPCAAARGRRGVRGACDPDVGRARPPGAARVGRDDTAAGS